MNEPQILFSDDAIVIIDKPSGMTVNRSDTTHEETTVQDWIEGESRIKYQELRNEDQSDFYKRAGIVHRLDKETSGILIVAKTEPAFIELQRQFKERVVEKTYIALVHGKVIPDAGEINVPVGRLSFNRKRFGIVAGGRESVTQYKTISNVEVRSKNNKEMLTLLELFPKTGRTHQIRVHVKYINHPIFSDELYSGRKTARNDRKQLPRLFLHASKISFVHPATQKRAQFESPLPVALREFLNTIEKGHEE